MFSDLRRTKACSQTPKSLQDAIPAVGRNPEAAPSPRRAHQSPEPEPGKGSARTQIDGLFGRLLSNGI